MLTTPDGDFNHELLGRIHGYAVVDVLGTAAGGLLFSYATGLGPLKSIGLAFAAGEIAHVALQIPTPFTALLLLNFKPTRTEAQRAC